MYLCQIWMQLTSTDEANQLKPFIFRQDIRIAFFTPEDSAITFSYTVSGFNSRFLTSPRVSRVSKL